MVGGFYLVYGPFPSQVLFKWIIKGKNFPTLVHESTIALGNRSSTIGDLIRKGPTMWLVTVFV